VIIGCLLIAFVALISLLNAAVGGVGGWFGVENLSLDGIMGWMFAPVAWLIGVPWHDAPQVGNYLGQKLVLNEFVAYSSFGPEVDTLDPKSVLVTTFALAGFANFASIAIQIGAIGGLEPERRHEIARYGLLALLAGSLANLSNACIAGVLAG
jgi:CNT family concentrative nucleoside transporter